MFEYLSFNYEESVNNKMEIKLDYSDAKLLFKVSRMGFFSAAVDEKEGELEDFSELISQLEDLHIENWKEEYIKPVLDGYSWDITYKQVGIRSVHSAGCNDKPENFDAFKKLINLIFSQCLQK